MKQLLPLLLLVGCARTYSPNHTECDLILAGAWDGSQREIFLTIVDLQDVEWRVLGSLRDVRDKSVINPINACSIMQGVKVFVHPTRDFVHPWSGEKVVGYANCAGRNIVIGTPISRAWFHSALAHEMFHILQNCKAEQPPGPDLDVDHANWQRDGIFNAIINVENQEWNP